MDYDKFVEKLAGRAGTSTAQAATLAQATLQTLAERISGGQARDLAMQLPAELKACLRKQGEFADPFGLPEFIRRVSERAGVNAAQASEEVRAVFATLREAVSIGEFEDAVDQLSSEFRYLLEPIVTVPANSPRRRG